MEQKRMWRTPKKASKRITKNVFFYFSNGDAGDVGDNWLKQFVFSDRLSSKLKKWK